MLPFQSARPVVLPAQGNMPAPAAAQVALDNAIRFATDLELPVLLDRALRAGARLDRDLYLQVPSYDEHYLVFAVRANRPALVQALLARGVELPLPPQSGIDLLMEACVLGRREMARTLLTIAGYDAEIPDRQHRTALHFAALGESSECVALLLDDGARPDVFSSAMDRHELDDVFGTRHDLNGSGITSLMIAAGRGNPDIIALLLASGASPDAGACAPLILAARRDHPVIVRQLLDAGATVDQARDECQRGALHSLLHYGASDDCLRMVAAHHAFGSDDGTANSPLGIAVMRGTPSQVALLLGMGAPVEPYSDEEVTLWDLAFQRSQARGALLDLMAATRPMLQPPTDDIDFCTMLGWIACHHTDPARIAGRGFFPSWLPPLNPMLARLRPGLDELQPKEAGLQIAFDLLARVPDPTGPDTLPAEPGQDWRQFTQACRTSQVRAIRQRSQALVDATMDSLRFVMSSAFLQQQWTGGWPQQAQPQELRNQLIRDFGFPGAIAAMLASAWSHALAIAGSSVPPGTPLPAASPMVVRIADNILRCGIDDLPRERSPLEQHCLDAIAAELDATPSPLADFCADPVAWLRAHEQRVNLRAVNPQALAAELQPALGLPPATCGRIASAWATAIDTARRSNLWQTTAGLNVLLASLMGDAVSRALSDEENMILVADDAMEALVSWELAVEAPTENGEPLNLQPVTPQPQDRQSPYAQREPSSDDEPVEERLTKRARH